MADVELPQPDEIEEQAAHRFTRRVAFVTALYAVVLAITSLGGSNAMKEMLVEQQAASNQWAYYQAKVIRENLYKVEAEKLSLDLTLHAKDYDASQAQAVEKLRDGYAATAARYGGEKQEIKAKAEEHEAARDLNQRKDPFFDYAEVLLQIAIVLSSISMLARNLGVFLISLIFAFCGLVFSADGYAVGTKYYVPLKFLESGEPAAAAK